MATLARALRAARCALQRAHRQPLPPWPTSPALALPRVLACPRPLLAALGCSRLQVTSGRLRFRPLPRSLAYSCPLLSSSLAPLLLASLTSCSVCLPTLCSIPHSALALSRCSFISARCSLLQISLIARSFISRSLLARPFSRLAPSLAPRPPPATPISV